MSAARPPWAAGWPVLMLLALVAAVFSRTAGFPFVYYDDPHYVLENPFVRRGLTWEGARWALTTFHAANWHPLAWLSHMLDVQLFGLWAGGHHVTNVVFHGANVVLLFFFFGRATGAWGRSWLVAALFAVHPLHVESVAWVAERKDVLSTFFGLLALGAYARYAERPGAGRYALVAVWLVSGLAAKPMLVTLPCLLLVLDRWPLGRREGWMGLATEKLPLLALSAASAALTVLAQGRGGAVLALEDVPLWYRALHAAHSYGAYLADAVWPAGLAVFYPHPAQGGVLRLRWVLLALGLLVAVSIACWCHRRSRPWLLTGWVWYLGTLVPVIGLVQVGAQARADRYTYLPLVGVFVMAAWLGEELLRRAGVGRRAAAAVAAAWVLALSAAAWRQVGYWEGSYELFARAHAVTERNWMALTALGREAGRLGRTEEAVARLREALVLNPDFGDAHYNLFVALRRAGRSDEALPHLLRALELDPGQARARNQLGVVFLESGKPNRAAGEFRRALGLNPFLAEARNNLGVALAELGQPQEAVAELRTALDLDPDHSEAHFNLGGELAAQGDLEAAEGHLRAALRGAGAVGEVHAALAEVLDARGRHREAAEHRAKAERQAASRSGGEGLWKP